jgi:serine/threonine protein kinase
MIGEKLGRYNLLREIGSGTMGTVYYAEEMATSRIVAVKLVRANVLYDTDRRERFLQGLLAASQIRHPGICPILEIGDDDDDFFIVIPLLQGVTLALAMKRGLLPWSNTLKLGIAISAALQAVHVAGAVHRALKPSNIWMLPDEKVVLTDCCVARFTETNSHGDLTSTLPRQEFADTIIPMGALAYMSPEQVRGESVDHRSDIFALGAILYEMLSERHPFEARNSVSRISAILDANPAPLKSKKQRLPKNLDSIIRRALERRPEARYGDLRELDAACRVLLDGACDSESGLTDPDVTCVPHRRLWKIAGILALAVTVITIILYKFLSK